jgi:nicotinamidase-related amidase
MENKHRSMKVIDKKDRKLALVIIDVQKKFIIGPDDSTLDSAAAHTPLMLSVIEKFREAGRPVIWILYEGETCLEGITEETYELLDGFSIDDSDIVIVKHHMNSFNETDLAETIKANDCDAMLIMGMFAQYCVMSTYWAAFDNGVSPYLMKGGLLSTEEKYCDLATELCKYYTLDELDENLVKNRKK